MGKAAAAWGGCPMLRPDQPDPPHRQRNAHCSENSMLIYKCMVLCELPRKRLGLTRRAPVPRTFDPDALADRLLENEEQADRAADTYRWENADLLAAALPDGEATDAQVNEALEVVLEALEARGSAI